MEIIMNMSIWQILLDLFMVAVAAFVVYLSFKEGFVKSFFKYMKVTIVIALTVLIAWYFVGICREYFVEDMVHGKVTAILVERAEKTGELFDFDAVLKSMPPLVKNVLPMERIENYFDSLSGEPIEVARKLGASIEYSLIDFFAKTVAYIGTFIVMYLLCTLVIFLLEKCVEIPAFKGLNRVMGVFWGLSLAYVTLSFLVCVVTVWLGRTFVLGTYLTRMIYKFGLFTF